MAGGKIKAIIFDIGGVVVDSPIMAIRNFCVQRSISDLNHFLFSSSTWAATERGQLAWSRFAEAPWGDLRSAMLKGFTAKMVLDVTPGSGRLAEAGMEMEVNYVGLCASEKHRTWLDNILTKADMQHISNNGHTLYQEGLADLISKHLAEVLEDPGDKDQEDPEADEENED
eukprot:s8457_g1.t1